MFGTDVERFDRLKALKGTHGKSWYEEWISISKRSNFVARYLAPPELQAAGFTASNQPRTERLLSHHLYGDPCNPFKTMSHIQIHNIWQIKIIATCLHSETAELKTVPGLPGDDFFRGFVETLQRSLYILRVRRTAPWHCWTAKRRTARSPNRCGSGRDTHPGSGSQRHPAPQYTVKSEKWRDKNKQVTKLTNEIDQRKHAFRMWLKRGKHFFHWEQAVLTKNTLHVMHQREIMLRIVRVCLTFLLE